MTAMTLHKRPEDPPEQQVTRVVNSSLVIGVATAVLSTLLISVGVSAFSIRDAQRDQATALKQVSNTLNDLVTDSKAQTKWQSAKDLTDNRQDYQISETAKRVEVLESRRARQ